MRKLVWAAFLLSFVGVTVFSLWLFYRMSQSEGKGPPAAALTESLQPERVDPSILVDMEPCPSDLWQFEAVEGTRFSPDIQEMSGVALSRTWKDVIYHINDSGNSPDLLLTDSEGQNLRKIAYAERNSDPEDLGEAACPWGGRCLYIADTGDNFRLRSAHQLWVIEESHLFDQARRLQIDLVYPQEQRLDIEAMAVTPEARVFYFFTKEKGRSQVLEGRWDGQATSMELKVVAVLERSMVTGASMHPSGRRLVLLNVQGALELSQDPQPGFVRRGRAWFPFERRFSLPYLAQQEAITYALNGRDLLYTSERKPWSRAPWGWMWVFCR